MKNKLLLSKFVAYCEANPDQRFFQALRNFSQIHINPDINFIFFAGGEYNNHIFNDEFEKASNLIIDTWNIE